MPNPVTWFEIIGPDAKATQKFYRDVFGWKMTPSASEDMGFYSMLQDHEPGIGGGLGQGPARVSVYIEAADPQKLLDKAVANGATMMMPVTTITPDTTIAMFSDPAGNTVGLLKANPRAVAASSSGSNGTTSRTARPRAKTASRAKTGTSRARTRGTTAARKTSTKRATGASKRKKRR
jgi:uncharacterized protein